jgi:hypothetical protein
MKLAAIGPVTDVAIEAPDRRFRKIAIAVVTQAFECAIDRPIVDLLAILRRTLDASEGATHGVDFGALIAEAILHQDVDSSAERVEAERGVIGYDGNRPDRGGRDQVPVDGVAERFVDAHPVLINCQSLRSTGDRRRIKTSKLYARHKWISGSVADDEARHVLLQRVGNVQRVGSRDLRGTNGIDRCRHLVDIHSGASRRRRRRRIDKNPAHVPGGLRLRRASAASRLGGRGRSDDLDGRQNLAIAGRRLSMGTVNAGNEA